MNFETYLQSKKIDSDAFRSAEPDMWESWRQEFEHLHPSSFTAQKLYLINPIRRLYHLKITEKEKPVINDAPKMVIQKPKIVAPSSGESPDASSEISKPAAPAKPVVPRPVFKPKPKTT